MVIIELGMIMQIYILTHTIEEVEHEFFRELKCFLLRVCSMYTLHIIVHFCILKYSINNSQPTNTYKETEIERSYRGLYMHPDTGKTSMDDISFSFFTSCLEYEKFLSLNV